jgi:hypothetical protein
LGTEVLTMWRLPSGGIGAMRKGQVFPLQPDSTIDISGVFHFPDQCAHLIEPPNDPIPVAWTLSADDPPLVLIQGDETARDALLAAVEAAGGRIWATGPYLAASQSLETAPDWFAVPERLSRPALQTALVAVCAASAPVEIPQGDRLTAAAEREAVLRQALERLRAETRSAADKISELAARLHETEIAWTEEATARAAAEQLAEAARQAAVPSGAPATPPASARRAAEELADAVAALLPRLNLLRGSRETLAFSFRNRTAVLRALRELQDRPSEVLTGWKMIRGAGSWRERHISNGQDDSGRLYARLNASGEVDVFLSGKGSQDRDIAWLAQQ